MDSETSIDKNFHAPALDKEQSVPPKESNKNTAIEAPTISRSWSVRTTHAPIFTGGKVTQSRKSESPFLLLPVGGDVCVVDAHRGVPLTSVRGNRSVWNDDDDGIDGDAITAYALSWNDEMLITCTHNSELRQYSLRTNEEAKREIVLVKSWGKSGHTLPVTDLELHLSGVFLATASVDGSTRIWDVRGAFATHSYRPTAMGYDGGGSGTLSVTSIKWLEDSTDLVLAIGRDDGSITIQDLRNSKPQSILRDHVSAVTGMSWSSDRKFFVSTGRDAVVNLWKVKTRNPNRKKRSSKDIPQELSYEYERIQTLPVYEALESMVILPGTLLSVVTAGSKGIVRVWQSSVEIDKPKLKLKMEQPAHESFGERRGGYMYLCYKGSTIEGDPSGTIMDELLVADAEHNLVSLRLSDLVTRKTLVGHNDDILDLKIIPNSDRIVVATNSAQVRIFDLRSFSCSTLDRHSSTVLCVDVSPCGKLIATCGKDKNMRVWINNVCVAVAVGHTEAVGSVAFSRKVGRYQVGGKAAANGGGAFCVTASADRTLKRWNIPGVEDLEESGKIGKELALVTSFSVKAHDKDINIVTVAPNDSYVATGSQDKNVKLWRATDLSLVATLKGHKRGIWDCQFSPFDRVIATSSGDKTIKIWNLSDFSCVRTFQGHQSSVLRVRFLSGGLQLVSAGADGLIKLWTIRSNECETTMDEHNDKVWAMDLAPDGKMIVSGGADSSIIVWEDVTKQEDITKELERTEAILLDQKLMNHMRNKEFGDALDISLSRDKPLHTLRVINAIIECDLQKEGSCGSESLRSYARNWSLETVLRVLRYCREWNTRARNSGTAMLTIRAILTSFRAESLASTQGVPEILAGIIPYAERHFDRLDRLCSDSYIFDYLLNSMGSLDDEMHFQKLAAWESSNKLILPTKTVDGRVQVDGIEFVGQYKPNLTLMSDDSCDELQTLGETDSSYDG